MVLRISELKPGSISKAKSTTKRNMGILAFDKLRGFFAALRMTALVPFWQ